MISNYEITEGQIAVIQAIRAIQTRDGIPPSYQDIADELECSVSTIQHYIRVVIRKGLITMQRGKYRSIRLTAAASTVPEKKRRRAA